MQRTLSTAAAFAVFFTASAAEHASVRAATQTAPAVLTVHVKDFRYNPTPITIHAGERVTFVNYDDEAHTITARDKSFDSQGLDGGQSWQHVFTTPGTYDYFCELHPYMKAEIIVLPIGGARGGAR